MDDSSSLYDQFSGHAAPTPQEKPLVREQNWQSANNERFKRGLPDHVKDAMVVTQKDLSFYAFTRFVLKNPPRDSFEAQVNEAHKRKFGPFEYGFDFIAEREKYIKFYRGMMG